MFNKLEKTTVILKGSTKESEHRIYIKEI